MSKSIKKRTNLSSTFSRKKNYKCHTKFTHSSTKWCEDCESQIFEFLYLIPNLYLLRAVCHRWKEKIAQVPSLHAVVPFQWVNTRKHKQYWRNKLTDDVFECNKKIPTLSSPLDYLVKSFCTITHLDLTLCGPIPTTTLEVVSEHLHSLKSLIIHSARGHQGICSILEKCRDLQYLEVLSSECFASAKSCQPNSYTLKTLILHRCSILSSKKVGQIASACGVNLKKIVMTGGSNIDSSILSTLKKFCPNIIHLSLPYSYSIQQHPLNTLLSKLSLKLIWLDLSYCEGFQTLPECTFEALSVLLLAKTSFADSGLFSISRNCINLRRISLQGALYISDRGVRALASCTSLVAVNLGGCKITEVSIKVLDNECPQLKVLELESCRRLPRELRQRYARSNHEQKNNNDVQKLFANGEFNTKLNEDSD